MSRRRRRFARRAPTMAPRPSPAIGPRIARSVNSRPTAPASTISFRSPIGHVPWVKFGSVGGFATGAVGGFGAARHGDDAGSHQFADAIGAEQVGDLVEFIGA